MTLRVLIVGLGPIGASVARQVIARKGFTLVGAVDVDPAKVGRDAADVIGADKPLRVKVTRDIGPTIKSAKPDVAVLCTSSSLKSVVGAVRRSPQAPRPDRHHDRGSGVSLARQSPAGCAPRRGGAQGQSRGARHRRQSRLHDGRAADRADGGLRARRRRLRCFACRTRASGACRFSRRSAPG